MSKSQVYGHLHQFLQNNLLQPGKIMHAYKCIKMHQNDGCYLKKYSKHPSCCDLTPTARYLSQTNIVIDRGVGHVDSWCKKECDLHLFPDLNKVSKFII